MTADVVSGRVVRAYEPGRDAAWDDLVSRSCNGTFLHSRRFISHHGDRFRDRSLVIVDRRARVVGVFAAAEDPGDPRTVVSHPGLTYGGVVHDGSVRGASMTGVLEDVAAYYRELGYGRLRYKAVPAIYHAVPAQDDLYVLFRLGARRYRSDLSAAIDLANRGPVQERRARSRRRAEGAGVRTEQCWEEIDAFWRILELNLSRRHGASPVHSLAEIRLLRERFPDKILLIAAKVGEVPVGGVVLFAAGPVLHMQYTATTDDGRVACATDPAMEHAIALGRQRGCRYFDFGTCTVDQGRTLDVDLYDFKASFGAGGVVYDHYELDLRQLPVRPGGGRSPDGPRTVAQAR
ncbi:MAG: GNAT family N-acetyltransferase [Actinomycetota bacterium]|nr:GNAT family N-acetyltransferase [Actinomycetota bacterium]